MAEDDVENGELVGRLRRQQPDGAILAHDQLVGHSVCAIHRDEDRLLGTTAGHDLHPTDAQSGRTAETAAQIGTQSIGRHRRFEPDVGRTAHRLHSLGEEGTPQLVDSFEEPALDVHQLGRTHPIASLAAARQLSDDVRRLPTQFVEALRTHVHPVRLAEQGGELGPELGAQLRAGLLLDDELTENPVDQRRRVNGRRRGELGQKDLSHRRPDLPVIERTVVRRLAHQAPGRTMPSLMDSPRTWTGGSAPLRGLRLVSRKPHPPGTPSTLTSPTDSQP